MLTPLVISRSENERVLIESSVNSIRISLKIKKVNVTCFILINRFIVSLTVCGIFFKADDIERILSHKFNRFMMMRAEGFIILRKVPVKVIFHIKMRIFSFIFIKFGCN